MLLMWVNWVGCYYPLFFFLFLIWKVKCYLKYNDFFPPSSSFIFGKNVHEFFF